MLEVIVALIGLAFFWAYLYGKAPESSTVSGFAFRLLFLGMALWTVHLLVWSVFSLNTTVEIYQYDATGNLVGKELQIATPNEAIRQSILTYLDVLTWVIYTVLALILVFFIYNTITSVMRREK